MESYIHSFGHFFPLLPISLAPSEIRGQDYGIIFSPVHQTPVMKNNPIAEKAKKIQPGESLKKTGKVKEDLDDLVHSREDDPESAPNLEDPDDRVHRSNHSTQGQEGELNNMEDPDDLVHDYHDEQDDR